MMQGFDIFTVQLTSLKLKNRLMVYLVTLVVYFFGIFESSKENLTKQVQWTKNVSTKMCI